MVRMVRLSQKQSNPLESNKSIFVLAQSTGSTFVDRNKTKNKRREVGIVDLVQLTSRWLAVYSAQVREAIR